MIKYTLFFFLLVSCASKTPNKQSENKKQVIINLKDLGAKGDGVSNDYPVLLQAANILNTNGSGKLIIPRGVYLINEYHTQNNNLNDIIFKNVKDLIIEGDSAIISVTGNFHRNLTHQTNKNKFSNTKAIIPIWIENSENVRISGLEIDGNVDNMTRDKGVVEGGGHLLRLMDCKNVELNNLYLHHAQTDGLNIRNKTLSENPINTNYKVTNVISKNNARQALTIGGLTNSNFENCDFSETGYTNGSYGKHAPSAGLDIEPIRKHFFVKNITFKNCSFKNNLGSEIVLSNPTTTNDIFFENCLFDAGNLTKRKWEIINNCGGVEFNNCYFNLPNGSIYATWHKPGTSMKILNSTIKSGDAGILAISKNANDILVVKNTKLEFTGNKVKRFFPWINMENSLFLDTEILISKEKRKSNGKNYLFKKSKKYKNIKIKNSKKDNKPLIFNIN